MKESIALRKRFCKDFNIPIGVFDSPYFEQRMATIDHLFNCNELYALFMKEVSTFSNEEEYFAYYNKTKDDAIKYIQSRDSWEAFTNTPVPSINKYPKKEIYSVDNDGKMFISIDMKKANFSTIRELYPDLIGNASAWELFIGMFTDMEHIQRSKYIRQVILGACNPKKQTQWEKYLMENVALSIENYLEMCHIISVTTDEILIECDSDESMSVFQLIKVLEKECSTIEHLLQVTKFKLKRETGFGWVKQFIHPDSTNYVVKDYYEFKCVETDKYHILAKLYKGEELCEDDLVFYHNGLLAKYLEFPLVKN